MIEAVDWREYDTFFAQCRRLLDDGLLALQAIVVPDASFDRTKRHTDFIKAAIFPGGCLPSVGALTRGRPRRSELTLVHLDDIGPHYAETLRRWRANLADARDELAALGYDERFVRLWEFYFSYCEAGFDERYVSVVQVAFAAAGDGQRAAPTPRCLARPTPLDGVIPTLSNRGISCRTTEPPSAPRGTSRVHVRLPARSRALRRMGSRA